MSGEVSKSHEHFYLTDEEWEESKKRRAKSKKWHNSMERQCEILAKRNSKRIQIDGVIYESITKAANSLGVGKDVISSRYSQFQKSGFSEREYEIRVTKTIKIQNIKE